MTNSSEKIRRWVTFAMLAALVALLQVFGGLIPMPGGIAPTLALIPIVLGGVLLGVWYGAALGALFGLITVLQAPLGALTAVLFSEEPVLFVLIAMVKAIAAGIVPALVFGLFRKSHPFTGVIVASLSSPIVNTTLFLLGSFTILDAFDVYITEAGLAMNAVQFLFAIVITTNFLAEMIISTVLSPAIYRVIVAVQKRKWNAPQ